RPPRGHRLQPRYLCPHGRAPLMADERKNMAVRYSAEKYDHYTAQFTAPWDEGILWRASVDLRRQTAAAPLLLDVGTGTAQLLIKMAERPAFDRLRMIGLDFFDDMLEAAQKNVARCGLTQRIEIVPGDAPALPSPDEHVHLIISRSTLHHWARPAAALA